MQKKKWKGEWKLSAGNAREKFRIQENKFRMEEEKKKGKFNSKAKNTEQVELSFGGEGMDVKGMLVKI
jgi:hypothetical protein